MINWSQIPEPPLTKQRIKMLFQYVDEELNEFLEKITKIYKQCGIKYYVKPHHEFFMRLLIPSQLKAYSNLTDVLCLFDNRNDLMRSVMQKQKYVPFYNNDSFKRKLENQNHVKLQNSTKLLRKADQGLQSIQKREIHQMQGFIRKKICQWAKQQVLKGQNVMRKDVKIRAQLIAKQNNLRYGARWFKGFLSHDPELINLLTHGNSFEIKKRSSQQIDSPYICGQKKIKQGSEIIMKNDNQQYSSAYGAYSDNQFKVEQNYQYLWQEDEQQNEIKKESIIYPSQSNKKQRKEVKSVNKNEKEFYRQNFQKQWYKNN